MDNFTLEANETILYRREGRLVNKNENLVGVLTTNTQNELILTNLQLIFIKKTKKLFSSEEVEVEMYPIEEIKFYNNIPQIIQNNTCVDIYLLNEEKTFDFHSRIEAHKFINKAHELLTGKSISTRGADKVKGAVNLIDSTLGINSVDTVKNVVENGVLGTIMGKGVRHPSKGSALKDILTTTKEIINKKTNSIESTQTQKESTSSFEDQVESLKKLKSLLDAGIITQEEFDTKKKQILNL